MKDAFLCLIPKIDTPELVNQFEPISFSNTSYKILSKVIVNRICPYLNYHISPLQELVIML